MVLDVGCGLSMLRARQIGAMVSVEMANMMHSVESITLMFRFRIAALLVVGHGGVQWGGMHWVWYAHTERFDYLSTELWLMLLFCSKTKKRLKYHVVLCGDNHYLVY